MVCWSTGDLWLDAFSHGLSKSSAAAPLTDHHEDSALPPVQHKDVTVSVPEIQHKDVTVSVPDVAAPPLESKKVTVAIPKVDVPEVEKKTVAVDVPYVALPPLQHKEVAVEVPIVEHPPASSKNVSVEVPMVDLAPVAGKIVAGESKLVRLLEQLHEARLNRTHVILEAAQGLLPASKKEVYKLEKEITEIEKEIDILTPVRCSLLSRAAAHSVFGTMVPRFQRSTTTFNPVNCCMQGSPGINGTNGIGITGFTGANGATGRVFCRLPSTLLCARLWMPLVERAVRFSRLNWREGKHWQHGRDRCAPWQPLWVLLTCLKHFKSMQPRDFVDIFTSGATGPTGPTGDSPPPLKAPD